MPQETDAPAVARVVPCVRPGFPRPRCPYCRYRLYNLCAERAYPANRFHNRVAVFPFDDHHAPTMDLMMAFCTDATTWLEQHPDNVIAVHCKAGKGRTGTMIAALLLHLNLAPTAAEALTVFGNQRTMNGKGVTIPSQIRFVDPLASPQVQLARRAGIVCSQLS